MNQCCVLAGKHFVVSSISCHVLLIDPRPGSKINGASHRRPSSERMYGDAEGDLEDNLWWGAGPTPLQKVGVYFWKVEDEFVPALSWKRPVFSKSCFAGQQNVNIFNKNICAAVCPCSRKRSLQVFNYSCHLSISIRFPSSWIPAVLLRSEHRQ